MNNMYNGLTEQEAALVLKKVGLNKLPEKRPPTQLEIAFGQLKSPLVYILLIAAGVTWYL